MTTAELDALLHSLWQQGLELWLEGEQLRFRGNQQLLSGETLEQLRSHKPAIITALEQEPLKYSGFPLSDGQRGILLMQQLAPASHCYNQVCLLKLSSDVNSSLLQQALAQLLTQQPMLAARLHPIEAGFVQQPGIYTSSDIFQQHSISHDSDLQHLLAQEADRPFKLGAEPLLRVLLLQGGEPHLLLVCHHLIADFWALDLLTRQLQQHYQQLHSHGQPQANSASYKDYVLHERQWLESPEAAEAQQYWQQKLTPLPPLLELPADYPRPQQPAFTGSEFAFSLGELLTSQLKQQARAAQVTPFVWVLSCLQTLLHRYTGETVIAIGTPMANRLQREHQQVIGHFTNPVTLLADFSHNISFKALLSHNKKQLLQAMKYQAYPLQNLIEHLKPQRDNNTSPLFQVALSWNQISDAAPLKGRLIESVSLMEQRGAIFDLTLTAFDSGDNIQLSLRYNNSLFKPETIKRISQHLRALIDASCRDNTTTISQFHFRTNTEVQQSQLVNNTQADYPKGFNLASLFSLSAENYADAAALNINGQRVSYRALEEYSNQLAHFLNTQGIESGNVIALSMPRGEDMLAAILACLKCNCTYVPIDPAYPLERFSHILNSSQAKLLLSHKAPQSKLKKIKTQGTLAIHYLDAEAKSIRSQNTDFSIPKQGKITDNQLACVLFTSGSTGAPKGVEIPHRAIARLALNNGYIQLQPGDKFCYLSNISFDATNIEIWTTLLSGGELLCIDNDTLLNPHRFAEFVQQEKPQAAMITTALFNVLISYKPDLFRDFNYVMVGGEALDINQIRKCIEHGKPAHLFNLYGPTENGTVSTAYEITRKDLGSRTIPIGFPINNSQVYLHDEYGNETPFGVIGEIIVGGDGIATGYLNQQELTREKFKPDHYLGHGLLYATGDLGYLREDGAIIYAGRKDDQVKIRGYRIELGEIEQTLAQHKAIEQCCVIVKNPTTDSAFLAAYFTAGKPLQSAELKQYLRSQLPAFMVPSAFKQMDSLPINANGKIDKKALPAIQVEREQAFVAARTDAEQLIIDCWQELLGIGKIGVYDSFFELGGHSLLAVKTAAKLQPYFEQEISMRLIFEHPCAADLALAISQSTPQKLPDIVPAKLADNEINTQRLPASLAQQRLWFLQQLHTESRAYNMPIALRFNCSIKSKAIEQALKQLLQRHQALRTGFSDSEGVAYLHISNINNWTLPTLDLSRRAPLEAEQEARQQINLLTNEAFDLSSAPLFKASLLRLNANTHILALCLHHIIIDGWSVEILLAELGVLLQPTLLGSEPTISLPQLEVQYSDFSNWQRQWLQGDILEQQLEYWQQQLAGAPALINLPTDYPRPAIISSQGAEYHFSIDRQTVEKLKALAQQNNATLFMTLLSAYAILLARYSQQNDVCIGFPISGRNHHQLESVIGLFVNNLVVRCQLENNPNVHDFIQQVRETTIDAYAHQDVPFDLIVDALKLERSLSYTPLLQVSFALESQTLEQKTRQVLGNKVTLDRLDWNIAKYDLNLTCFESEGDIEAVFEYSTDLYDVDSIMRMAQHFLCIIQAITSNAYERVLNLNLLTAQEQEQFRLDVTQHSLARSANISAINRFEIQASQFASRTALSFAAKQLSYETLNHRANQLAHYLVNKGIEPGQFVGLYLHRSLDMVIAILAVLKTGAAYLPLDPHAPSERINFIIEDAELELVIGHSSDLTAIEVPAKLALDTLKETLDKQSTTNINRYIPLDSTAYIIYTSGTTGKPKGCLVSHQNLARLFTSTEPQFQFNEHDVWTLFHSYAFDFSVWEIWGALLYGGRLVIVPQEVARASDAFYQLLKDEQVTILNQTPSAFSQLITLDQQNPDQNTLALRQVIFGGEALDFAALRQWTARHPLEQTALINMYGITETTVHVTYHAISNEDLERGRSIIGEPLNDLSVYILDQHGQLLPNGIAGEMYVSGAGVTQGYLKRPELTAERFIDNTFVSGPLTQHHQRLYRSGDLARRLNNGQLEYLGRIDHQVKIRGYRIELGEIETTLASLDDIQESIVLALPDALGNLQLVAYLLSEQTELDSTRIRQQLKALLPEYMIPAAFSTVKSWPLTANGKIDKTQLPALATLQNQHNYVPPRNDTELVICRIWAEILGIEQVGIHDNFFELGGHSLLATQVAARIRSELDCKLELKAIFENPTVAELALEVLEEELDALDIDDDELLALLNEIEQE